MQYEGEYFAVRIECTRGGEFSEHGSGCVVIADCDEYDYVFTALHCLRGKEHGEYLHDYENHEIKIFSHYIKEDIIVKDSYPDEEKDIVVIKVEKVKIDRFIALKSCGNLIGETAHIPGFPAVYEEEGMTCETIINRPKQTGKSKSFFISVVNQINLSRYRPKEILAGFSGSGVYCKTNTCIFLTSIVTDLGDANFSFHELVSVDIVEFKTLIEKHKLKPVKQYEICETDTYIDKAFNSEENQVVTEVLLSNARKIKVDLNYFVDWLKEKMFIPYEDHNYSEEGLWIGWIKFLTFMYLYSDDNFLDVNNNCFDEKAFLDYIKEHRENRIKYYHSFLSKNMADVIYYVRRNEEIFESLKWGDTLIVNFGKQLPYNKCVLHDEASKIVASIDDARINELYEKGIDISDPKTNKAVDYYHVGYLEEQIYKDCSQIGRKKPDIESAIKKCIAEVMENANQEQRKTRAS